MRLRVTGIDPRGLTIQIDIKTRIVETRYDIDRHLSRRAIYGHLHITGPGNLNPRRHTRIRRRIVGTTFEIAHVTKHDPIIHNVLRDRKARRCDRDVSRRCVALR